MNKSVNTADAGRRLSDNPSSTAEALDARCFLPNFCAPRVVFLVIVVAELLAFVLALMSSTSLDGLWFELGLISLFIQWVALGSVAILCLTRNWLERSGVVAAALTAYLITLLMTLLISAFILWGGDYSGFLLIPIAVPPAEFLLRNLAICAIVSAVVFRYFYVQYQWQRNVQAEARSRLQALQARIRPHFLFNSMNTIANLTRTKPQQAEQTIHDLADLFRATLGRRERIALEEEIELTRRYLSIEACRLEERLRVNWQIGEDLPLEIPIPALVLQPLVENAIYHGIEQLLEGGEIMIRIEGERHALRVTVDNPVPTTPGQYRRQGNQMAQENIRQRLMLAFDGECEFKVAHTQQRYTVSFTLPRSAA